VSRSVRFEDEADAEYREAARWYERRRNGLGFEFLDAVDVTLEQIVRFPEAGAAVPSVSTELRVRRAPVGRFPYHVIYLDLHDTIRVLAVAHDRRKPGYWASRL
jgi:toxin ParE1/3/4